MKVNLLIALVGIIVITLLFYIINVLKLKSRKKNKNIMGIQYLLVKFNLKKELLLTKKMAFITSMLNALIIDIVFLVIVSLTWPNILKMVFGFVIMLGLIYSLYGILGTYLVKKGYKK